jgi:hypothetical protein
MAYKETFVNMIAHTVHYEPLAPAISPEDVKRLLPPHLASHLLSKEFPYGLFFDASNMALVQELDRYFQIGQSNSFGKWLHVEVSRSSIDDYPFYQILPHSIEPGVHIDANTREMSVDQFIRSIGTTACTPRGLVMGDIWHMMPGVTVLLIAARIRDRFESDGFTGLRYASVPTRIDAGAGGVSARSYCAAVVERGVDSHARMIVPKGGGLDEASARVVIAPTIVDETYDEQELLQRDFLIRNGVVVKGVRYCIQKPIVIVSRRVIKVLLEMKVKGLTRLCWRLNECFIPLMGVR